MLYAKIWKKNEITKFFKEKNLPLFSRTVVGNVNQSI